MKIPTSTYRIQFTSEFTFKNAKDIVTYLSDLGISHLYASPILQARKGSTHGYDAVTPKVINPELGTPEELNELSESVKGNNLGWIQDIVPNHMSFTSQNSMLMDVMESGKNSIYLDYFDIEWDHAYESIKGRLLTPVLGKLYSEALEGGELVLKYEEKGFTINYYETSFPIKMESYVNILTYKLNRLEKRFDKENIDYVKFLGVLYLLKNLEPKEQLEERVGQVKFAKYILWELYNNNSEIKKFIDKNIAVFNGEVGKPESFDLLDKLLSEQFYRLAFWKVANEEINYRRFFIVNELISLKIDIPKVFDYVHKLIFELMENGVIDGLRIDHIDGLYNPTEYLKRFREKLPDSYIVVEKILDLDETLPAEWPIQGTTGYEYMNYLNGIFCNSDNEEAFNQIYTYFSRFKTDYDELVYDKKKLMINHQMTGDIDNLAHLLKRISSKYRHGSDATLYGLRNAITELLILFPVYRTYINADNFETADYTYIKDTIIKAIERKPDLYHELKFLEHFLTYNENDHLTDEEKNDRIRFIMRFQQFTGPLMAKGFEDTALYVFNRLLSLNEVGGSPDKFGISIKEFHDFNQLKFKNWANTMNATSTHDTKRGEDVRARINVITEIPDEFGQRLKQWHEWNKDKKTTINRKNSPDNNDEYLIYQAIIGSYPLYENEFNEFISRLKEYILKAIKEAKVYTEWVKPDTEYEDACMTFIDKILEESEENLFLKDIRVFQKKISYYGFFNSLSQVLIKMTSPGVSDFYQGTELWDLTMVDPDNRRPVDFEKRKVFLNDIKNKEKIDNLKLINDISSHKEDGKIKLFLVYKLLNLKKEMHDLFTYGDYIPLETQGTYKDNIIAFARVNKGQYSITVAPRLLTQIIKENETSFSEKSWKDTELILPDNLSLRWKNIITGQTEKYDKIIPVKDLLKYFPVALLINEG